MNKKKILALLLITIFFIIAPSTISFAKDKSIKIHPYGGEYTVSSNDDIVISIGWGTCSEGLQQDYIKSVNNKYLLNNEPLKDAQKKDKDLWMEPYFVENAPWKDLCIWDVDGVWQMAWKYDLGKLDPGDYELVWERTYNFNVIDGYDQEGDGIPDVYGDFTRIVTTIHVVEP